jgi:hypothetical protein
MKISVTSYFFLSLITLIVGVLFFAYQQKIIIFNIASASIPTDITATAQKKPVSLFYWHNNQWQSEQIYLLFTNNPSDVMPVLINRWLSLLHTEKIIKKKSSVQAALLSYDGKTLFISFDRAPWNKESCTYEKWMQVEGLLKTIRCSAARPEPVEGNERSNSSTQPSHKASAGKQAGLLVLSGVEGSPRAGFSIKKVCFLSHHQPLQDPHLDFTNPWPIDGFLDTQ